MEEYIWAKFNGVKVGQDIDGLAADDGVDAVAISAEDLLNLARTF